MTVFTFFVAAERLAWSGLAALALLFLSIALRLREDREWALLGSGLFLICLVAAPDVWVPRSIGRELPDAWLAALQDGAQFAACAYVWVALRFTQALTGGPGGRALRIHTALLAAFGIGFYLDALCPAPLLIAAADGKYSPGPVYEWLFAPYLVALFGWTVLLTVRGWRRSHGEARRTLGALSFAYALLLIGGTLDFAEMLTPGLFSDSIPSTTNLAALSMGAVGIYLFTARLIGLYSNQREALLKLASIHEDLRAHRPLGELGRSAAHISESIRAYVGELKSDTESLRLHPAVSARAEVARVEAARRRLETFATGVLEYARIVRPGERRMFSVPALAAECLEALAPDARGRVRISGNAARPIAGDPAQLRRALGELIRNSLQAGAGRVEIRLAEGAGRISLVVEDDGPGFPPSQLERIAEPFFTTRKGEGACGLGAAIARGIFRAHGGSLAYYPAPARSGLLANAVLPGAGAGPAWTGGEPAWTLVCDDAARIERFLAVCANAGVAPAVRGSGDPGPWGALPVPGIAIVDAAAGPAAGLPARWKRFRLAGDPAEGDPSGGPAWLREETLIAMAASAAPGVTERLR